MGMPAPFALALSEDVTTGAPLAFTCSLVSSITLNVLETLSVLVENSLPLNCLGQMSVAGWLPVEKSSSHLFPACHFTESL